MEPVKIDSRLLLREIAIEITLDLNTVTEFRLWLFGKLMTFAAWVGGFGGIDVVLLEDHEVELPRE